MNNSTDLKQKIEETIIKIVEEHADESTYIVNHRECLTSDIHELIDEVLADQNKELREKINRLPHEVRQGHFSSGDIWVRRNDVLSLLNVNQEKDNGNKKGTRTFEQTLETVKKIEKMQEEGK